MRPPFKTISIFLLIIGITLPLSEAYADPPAKATCSMKQAKEAEEQMSSIDSKSWGGVYKSYKQYGQCDDGSVAEGYSDIIGRLLTQDWAHTSQLKKLTAQDKGFEKFILQHIDCLMSRDQANTLYDNAAKRCPTDSQGLCLSMLAHLKELVCNE